MLVPCPLMPWLRMSQTGTHRSVVLTCSCGAARALLPVQKSYSRTRQRFNNPAKQLKNIAHFYPCMRCDRGLLKLRHHLCPCDLEKVKAKNVVRVAYGEGPLAGDPQPGRRRGGAEAAEGGAEDDA